MYLGLTHMYLILGQKWPYEHNGIKRISRIGAKPYTRSRMGLGLKHGEFYGANPHLPFLKLICCMIMGHIYLNEKRVWFVEK